ncbi:MAG: LuxE/PaaK family acyltransferase [Candidatus Helarchaeales archaeon]
MPKSHAQLVNEYLEKDVYHFNADEIRQMQDELIRSTFKFHYANCLEYRKYCQGKGIDPSKITSMDDVHLIPLLDSRETLRKRQFFSVPREQIKYNFSSTGSSGKPLVWIGIDEITLEWSSRANISYMGNFIPFKKGKTLLMLPDIPQLKFAVFIKHMLPPFNQKLFFGLGFKFKPKAERPDIFPDLEVLKSFARDDGLAKSIVGFPHSLLNLKNWMEENDIHFTLGKDGNIITGGGWKPRDPQNPYGKKTREELEQIISDIFKVPRENIRDFYGATELMLGFPECVHHQGGKIKKVLHVNPFCHVFTVDPENLEPLPAGKAGIGVVIDFLAHSYPGFILTDDILMVEKQPCSCGVAGQTLKFIERVSELEQRGCAFKFQDQLFSEVYLEQSSGTSSSKPSGVIDYMVKNRLQISGDDIKSHEDVFKKAMQTIVDTLSFQSEDGKMTSMVILGKVLCYKKGKPTFLTFEEITRAIPEVNEEEIRQMLNKFKDRKFVKTKIINGQEKYYLSKKADEFGEAFFPLLLWALKYS